MASPSFEVLSLRRDFSLVQRDSGYAVVGAHVGVTLGPLPPGVYAGVTGLVGGGRTAGDLEEAVEAIDGFPGIPYFSLILDRLSAAGLVQRTIRDGNCPLVTLIPGAAEAPGPGPLGGLEGDLLLSRHVLLRNDGGEIVAESGLSHHRIVLHDARVVSLCAALARPCTGRVAAEMLGASSDDIAIAVLACLRQAEIIRPATAAGDAVGREVDPAPQWEVHDLYFHARSRRGRHANPYGGTYRFLGAIEPLPALKPPMSANAVPLDPPDLERIERADPPFTAVLERRRSIRQQGETPLTRAQLSEFLFRAARQRRLIPTDHGELSDRPYPGGGALYELEIYPVVERCHGLDSGLYQYRPGHHELCPVAPLGQDVVKLLDEAWLTLGRESRPQVLLIVAARFGRASWKYQSMAYALVLKDVGVLLQTFYLVATAMGLAPCALGGGDSDLFARASGLDWLVEGAVGEFVLGSRRDAEKGAA